MALIEDFFPGLGGWLNKNRTRALSGSREKALNLLGEAPTELSAGEGRPGEAFAAQSFGGSGLMADETDFGNQMRFSLGLMGLPGYQQGGQNFARQAMGNQLGLPMQMMQYKQDQANWEANQQRLETEKRTGAMQNIEAAGYIPDTPEYQAAMGQYLMKTDTTTINLPGQAELRSAGFAAQTIRSGMDINALEDAGYRPSYADFAASQLPLGFGNYAVSPEYQKYRAIATDWVFGNLRPESGAVIKKEEEQQYFETYFPQPGDSEATVAKKRVLRAQKEQIRIQAAGQAEVKVIEAAGSQVQPVAPVAGAGEGAAAVQNVEQPPPGARVIPLNKPRTGLRGRGVYNRGN